MHTYEKLWSEDGPRNYPVSDTDVFTCAEDVVAKASLWPLMGRATCPEVWHLDPVGHYVCGWTASSLCTLTGWAEDPSELHTHLRYTRLDGCTHDRWIIVDSRPTGDSTRPPVSEADAAAYRRIRTILRHQGIDLLDAVVFDDEQRWWSLRELTSGTTDWQE